MVNHEEPTILLMASQLYIAANHAVCLHNPHYPFYPESYRL